jgi:hypothetical protein
MSRKRKHQTTKNTIAKPPVTRMCIVEGDCNGPFKIIHDFTGEKELEQFDKIYRQWYDSPDTKVWHILSFLVWFKERYPNRMCLLYSDYERMTKGKVIPATKEEWERENN